MVRTEISKFFNEGFGWVCKSCCRSEAEEGRKPVASRLLSEGESEGKAPALSTEALAKWANGNRRILICPRCGAEEEVEKR